MGADIANLSPPSQLRVCSSAVSGMGGMSSVPCARERAELVRAWWVTASGSGVAICGDTGKKLDRPVPAGFETGPARDPGKSPRAGCLGHHHQSFKSDTRCPPRIPHPSHRSRAQARGGFGVSSSPNTRFFPEARSAVRDRLDAAHASRRSVDPGSAACLRRLKPAPAKAGGREKREREEKDTLMLSPDLFRGWRT